MNLHDAEVSQEELYRDAIEVPEGFYPGPEEIVTHMMNREGTVNVPTASLNVNGKVVQESMEKYLAAGEYLNSSTVKKVLTTPFHYFFAKESEWKLELDKHRKEAGHYKLGTFLHQCILEPTAFDRVVVEPSESLTSNDGCMNLIRFWEEMAEKMGRNSEWIIEQLPAGGIDKIHGKREYIQNLKTALNIQAVSEKDNTIIKTLEAHYRRYAGGIIPAIMKHSKREVSIYGVDEETGLNVRIRPDAIQFAENIGVDAIISVKSTSAEDLGRFIYDTAKYQYETSEAMYQQVASDVTGRPFRTTITVMFQTVEPYGVALLMWDPEDLEVGKYKYRSALTTIAECEEKQEFPGYESFAEEGHLGIIKMKQPAWVGKELKPQTV